jgi:threonine/homoserine/homoserine lactone efflux protein
MMWRSNPEIKARVMKGGLVRLFLAGFVLNISNPKMPIFYLALLPGILGIKPLSVYETVVLLVTIALIEVVVVGGHVLAAVKAKTALSDPGKAKLLNRSAGSLMVGAGVLVATR